MTDLTTSLVLQLRNQQWLNGLRQSGRGVEQFSRESQRELRTLKRDFQSLTGNVLGQFKSELLAIGSLYAFKRVATDSATLDKSLTRVTQTAGVLTNKSADLRKELFALQRQYGVLVDDSRKGNDALLQGGLGWMEALAGTRAIAPANAVTGAQPEVLASALGVSSEIFGFDLAQAGVATELLDKMTVAGRQGNAELEDLASIFARVGGNAKTANLSFDQTLGFIEQLSMIEKQPERLATLADSTLRLFTNQKYLQNVQDGLGIKFYDTQGNRRNSFDVIDDIASIYRKQKTDAQRDALIAYAFGETDLDTQRGIRTLLSGHAIAGMREKTVGIGQAHGTIERDLNDAIGNAIDQTSRLKGALREAADSFVQPFNDGITWGVKKLLDTKEQGGLGLDGADLALGGLGALAAGAGAYRYGGPAVRKLLGKGAGLATGVATGKALEAAAGVIPVYVVNMPSGFGTGGGAGSVVDDVLGGLKRGGKGAGPKLPQLPGIGGVALPGPKGGLPSAPNDALARGMRGLTWGSIAMDWGKWLAPRAGMVGAAGGAGYGIGTLAYDHAIAGTKLSDDIGRAIARALALFGNKNAQAALDAEAAYLDDTGPSARNSGERRREMRGQMKVVVEDNRVRVTQVRGDNLDIDVTGQSMGAY